MTISQTLSQGLPGIHPTWTLLGPQNRAGNLRMTLSGRHLRLQPNTLRRRSALRRRTTVPAAPLDAICRVE